MWRHGGSFRNLSGPRTPNAQFLWLYLLTGDATIAIPGVVPITREGLASRLNWTPSKTFNACLKEISDAGMALFDWNAGMVWCASAFRYNKPQSPNVVRSWGKSFDLLPECALKVKVWEAIRDYCSELGEAFTKAFTETFPEDFDEVFLFPVSVTDPDPGKVTPKKKGPTKARYLLDGFDDFWTVWPKKVGKVQAQRAWKKAIQEHRLVRLTDVGKHAIPEDQIVIEGLITHLKDRVVGDPQWTKDGGQFIPYPATFLNQSRWMDDWRPKKKRHAGERIEDGVWMVDTYRSEDWKRFNNHPRWSEYVEAMLDLTPRTAPPFEEWLKTTGGG